MSGDISDTDCDLLTTDWCIQNRTHENRCLSALCSISPLNKWDTTWGLWPKRQCFWQSFPSLDLNFFRNFLSFYNQISSDSNIYSISFVDLRLHLNQWKPSERLLIWYLTVIQLFQTLISINKYETREHINLLSFQFTIVCYLFESLAHWNTFFLWETNIQTKVNIRSEANLWIKSKT